MGCIGGLRIGKDRLQDTKHHHHHTGLGDKGWYNMQFLNLIFAVIVQLYLVDCAMWTIRNLKVEGECTYRGYCPGGDVTNIADIKPPTLQIRAVNGFLGRANQAAGFTETALSTVAEVSKVMGSVAATMGPVLGIFGAVTDVINDETA